MAGRDDCLELIGRAFTNQWGDGRWSWFCHSPPGGAMRATREEAIADLLAYAKREANHLDKRGKAFAAMMAGD